MVLNSNSISLTAREPALATRGEESKSPDKEGTRAEEKRRHQPQEEDANEDQRKQLPEQLTLERERKEQQYQEELPFREAEQKRQAGKERETSIKIYQYRRSVSTARGHVWVFSCLGLVEWIQPYPSPASEAPTWSSCSPPSILYTGEPRQSEPFPLSF